MYVSFLVHSHKLGDAYRKKINKQTKKEEKMEQETQSLPKQFLSFVEQI
jgi:hypothetical protein